MNVNINKEMLNRENEMNESSSNEVETIDSISIGNDLFHEEEVCLQTKIFFSKNEYYEGEINDICVPHGNGKLHFENGDLYIGDFLNGMKHGKGLYKYNTGNIYKGDWENDVKNGEGIFININDKFAFKGIFINDESVSDKHTQFLNEEQYMNLVTKEELQSVEFELVINCESKEDINENDDTKENKFYTKDKRKSEKEIKSYSTKTKDSVVESPMIKYVCSTKGLNKKNYEGNSNSDKNEKVVFHNISINLYNEFFKHITISQN